ncbi:hypothetical protein [Rhodohalobacter sulfatireducens]|nr:hypothetical protein [Rhodohalobacter sulfatireducens]
MKRVGDPFYFRFYTLVPVEWGQVTNFNQFGGWDETGRRPVLL